MKGGAMLWWIGAALALGIFVYWLNSDPAGADRYKMTVEVNTPQGPATGFAVRAIKYQPRGGFAFGESKPQWYLTGEAVALDLPGGKTMFALLTGEGGDVSHAGRDIWNIMRQVDGDTIELWPNGPKDTKPRIGQPAPMLVTFGDVDDPTSVAKVDPNDLRASFGEGYALKRITVQITDEPVTVGIDKRLEWLDSQVGSLVRRPAGVPIGEMPKAQRLSKSAFRSGVTK